jgi:hypothetical protein
MPDVIEVDEFDGLSRERTLVGLSEALLVQHLRTSWPLPGKTPTWFPGESSPDRYHESVRTVAIVGAGASLPIASLADDLVADLEKELGQHDRDPREEYLNMLEVAYDLGRDQFETRLMALCHTQGERAVQDAIGTRYRHRHPTLLAYELLAHLLHHRFIDMVISFNFDELLDQSIEDELGPNEFTRVISERDFDPSQPPSGPLYIKPHGTAAEPESLRFTKERYFTIPKSIASLIESRFDVEHLVVLNLGFSMVNVDFQYLLRKPTEVEIFNFNPHPIPAGVIDEIAKRRQPITDRRQKIPPGESDFPTLNELAPVGADPEDEELLGATLTEVVDSLDEACAAESSGPARFRSIERHQGLCKLLGPFRPGSAKRHAEYLHRRAVLEIAFAAAKGRGVVSIASLADDRCGRYYDLYAAKAEEPESWSSVCESGGLKANQKSPDSYEVLPKVRDPAEADGDIHTLRVADPELLAEHVVKSLGHNYLRRGELIKTLAKTLATLQEDTEIEVHSRDDRVCSKIFTDAKVLKTLTALRGWTNVILESDRPYNELWVVAETGEWLSDPEIVEIREGRPVQLRLLRAFKSPDAPRGDWVDARVLPWGRHNRHMTIVCDSGKPRAAIYFARRLRTPTVTPVHLSDGDDLDRMTAAFEQLWKEAGEYEAERP